MANRPRFRIGECLGAFAGSNPAPSACRIVRQMPKRKRPVKVKPALPEEDVRRLQDPEHTEADFLRDLDRASTDRANELLEDHPSEPDRGKPRT